MKPKEKLLWKNKWLSVYELDDWYTIYRNGTTNQGVAILVFRDGMKEILMRVENCLPHGGFVWTSITGTVEKDDSILKTAVKELKEETGYTASESEMKDLGYIYPSKASDFKLHLFGVDVTGKNQGAIVGDGSKGEQGASVRWGGPKDAIFSTSSAIPTMMVRYKILYMPG